MDFFKKYIKPVYRWFISGIWFVNIVRQIVVTGGNIAESAFLLATLWVIVNAVAHKLLTWIMPTHIIELINYLSVIAFSALPELIIIPVTIICLTHWFEAIQRKSKVSATWALCYTIPTVVFFVMTIAAITTFVSTGGSTLVPIDGPQLVVRCLAGWMYAVVNMLFKKLGEPHYASNMQGLKTALTQKQEEIQQLKSQFEQTLIAKQNEFEYQLSEVTYHSKNQIEHFQNLLDTQNEHVKKLSERAFSLERNGLENFPKVVSELIDQDVKTVSVDRLSELTGISKRRINANKSLQRHSRNRDLIMVNSVIEWLKAMPLSEIQSLSNGHMEYHTDPLGLPIL